MKSIKYFPIIIIVTIIAGAMAYWVIINNQDNYDNHKKEILKRFKSTYTSLLSGYDKAALVFYSQVIQSEEVMTILRELPQSYGDKKDQLRKNLYELLQENYDKLKKQNILGLHFQLPTGESFLRFHKPEKFGDNIFTSRYSVEKANKSLKISKGFEEGKINQGYRFVFPIIENGKHYGSVELVIPFIVLSEDIEKVEKVNTSVLLKKDILNNMVFESEKDKYKICTALPDYFYEKSYTTNSESNTSISFFEDFLSEKEKIVSNILHRKYATLEDISYKNENILLINIPIPNTKGKQIGSFLIAYKNNGLQGIKYKLVPRLGILVVLYLSIIIALVSVIRRNKKLIQSREQAKKSEIDLAETGEIKNKLFEIITHDLRNHFNAVNGFIDLLGRRLTFENEKIQKLFFGLNDANELTNNLMDNLFIWSRIQIKKIELQEQTFEASSWQVKELKRFENIIRRKNIKLTNNTKGPVYYKADIDMMKYIHQNILLNAIRYSEKGGKITTKIIDQGNKTILTIKDEGKGMSSSEVSKIMNQDNWSGSKLKTEIGLGLLVTRKLVTFQQGSIHIESAKGIGTTVKIEIPK